MPKVSVVMSVYNGEEFLEDVVISILNQTFEDFEFIIVNDGSRDGSLEIINKYAADDRRIVVIDHKENIGLTRALSNAIQSAQGRFIVRQDVDDISSPTRIEQQVKIAENSPSTGIVACRVELFDKTGSLQSFYDYVPTPIFKLLVFTGNVIVHGSVLFEKELFNEVGGYREKFRCSQDYDLWLRMMEKKKLVILSERLYSLRISGTSISSMKYNEQTGFAAAALYFFFQRRFSGRDSYGKMEETLLNKNAFLKLIHSIILLRHGKFREIFSRMTL